MHDLSAGVKVAVEAFGTRMALAEALGIERSAISQWQAVPPRRAIEIEALTGGRIKAKTLRPDLYDALPRRKAKKAA